MHTIPKKEYPLLVTYALMLLAIIFWSVSFVWAKIAFQYYTPLSVIFFRLLICLLFTFIGGALLRNSESVRRKDILWFALIGFAQPFCYFLGESYGLSLVSPVVSALIIGMIPTVSPLFSSLFLKEKPTLHGIIGLIISFCGIVYTVVDRNLDIQYSGKGLALLGFAVISTCCYMVLARKLSVHYTSYTIVKYQNCFGTLYFLPLFLFFDFRSVLALPVQLEALKSLFYLGFLCSFLAFVFFTAGIARLGVLKGNIFVNLIPAFTAIAAYFMLGEQLTSQKLVGFLLTTAGVLYAQFGDRVFRLRARMA